MKSALTDFRKGGPRWLRSYISIVLAIMLVLTLYSTVIINQVRNDAEENNRCFANYYHTAIEQSLKSLRDYTSTLLYSNKSQKLHTFGKQKIDSSEALQISYDLVYDIRNFIVANGMLEDIYLYYPEFDQIIGKKGAYASYAYFKTENLNVLPQRDEYQNWMETLFAARRNGFYTHNENGENVIYYYHCAFYGSDSNESRIIVARLGQHLLNDSIQDLVSNSGYAFAGLLDENGEIYAEAGDRSLFLTEDGLFNFDISRRKYLIYEADSSLWPLTFVAAQDFNSAYKIVRLTAVILTVGLLFALLVGVSLALFYARRNKTAIDQIKGRFKNVQAQQSGGDLDYIGEEIDNLLSANKNAIDALDRQERIIASFFLQELLQRESCTEKDVGQLCAMYRISLENPLFSIVAAWQPEPEKPPLDYLNLQKFVEYAADDNFIVYMTRIGDMEVFLCNYEGRTKSPQGPVLEFAKQMRQRCDCRVEISAVLQSSAEICTEWQQMSRKLLPDSASPVRASIGDEALTVLREFNDAIDQDDLTEAIALVPELNQKFLIHTNRNLMLCRKYTLLAKLYESFDTEQMRARIDALLDMDNAYHWEQKLIELLQELDQNVNRKVDMRQVAEIAWEMIQREYNNPQMSLQMIADHIGVSQSYLSRLFKAKYGISVIQYLNYVRIEQAKQQMLSSPDNLKVIAMNVGFSSDVNMIRVFKKFENTTPGNYRSKS